MRRFVGRAGACQTQHGARLEKSDGAICRLIFSSGAPFGGVLVFSWCFFFWWCVSPAGFWAVPRPSPIRWIRLSLRIQRLHLIEFLGGDLRQVPDEQNQAPGFLRSVRFAEGWHAAQTNSILNSVVELAIALVLRPGRTQVGRFRIEALAEKRLATSVIRMARGAMIGEMLHACPNV